MDDTQTIRRRNVCPHDCPDTCSMVVTVRDGTAVDLRGDRDHPFTRGFLCQKVAALLERVYHPDRLLWPMKRVGAKGAGKFVRITWDEALDTIRERFHALAASPDGPQSILPYSYCGTMGKLQGGSLDRRFFHLLGASLLDRTICSTAGEEGCDVTLGTRAMLDPETIVHARYIINWGSNTSVTNSHLWALMHQARKRGARIVTIDPHRSKTAAKSDWWIPVRPGTDAALALGLMHILFREAWQDGDYLERYCLGTEQLRQRVLEEYPPAKVASITGLDEATIERLGAEYGQARQRYDGPALIRLNYGLQRHGGGAAAVRAVTCLPAITGDWRYAGGGALLSTSTMYPFFDSSPLERPDLIKPGTRTINMVHLGEALAGQLPGPPVHALYVYNSNPAAVCPNQNLVLEGLRREDLFTVVHEQFPTDTVDYADVVLPATTQLEHFDIHGSYGHVYVQLNEPSIAPLGEAKCNTDVFRLLAKQMGMPPELFEISDEELARESLRPRAWPKRYPLATAFDGIDLERLRREGSVRLNIPRDFAPFAEGKFDTPSGKCEMYSPRLAALGLDPLPAYVPPHEDPQTKPDLARRFPLQMLCPPAPEFLNSSFGPVDSLRRMEVEPKIEMHPSDAAARGIADGQMVRVFNDRGSFLARAVVGATVKPGVVVTYSVWWNKHSPEGGNCNATTSSQLSDLGGCATFFDNLVQVNAVHG